jgi:outer membrane receptor protein involved in Fe transport
MHNIPNISSRLALTAALPLILLAAPAIGQTEGAPQDDDTGIIIVTGRALDDTPAAPAYGSVRLERDDLLQTGSGRIEDALASVAGFQQFRRSDSRSANPSAQGVSLRALGGNATSRALVLLDGVPMGDPFFGYVPLSALAPERLGSGVVTRGGGSGPFGAGALAGTIELFSADAETLGSVDGQALVDNRGSTEISGAVTPRLGNGWATVSGRWDRGEGFWTTPPEQRVPASVRARYDGWSVQLRGVAPVSATTELQARVLAFRDTRTLRFRGADSLSEGQDASVRLIGRGRWQYDLLGYVQARDFANVVVSATRFTSILDQRRTPSTGIGGKFELRPPVGDGHVLRAGMDYRLSQGTLQEDALSAFTGAVTERRRAGGSNSDLGLFVENDWTLGPLILTAGARADRYAIRDGFFEARSPAGEIRTGNRFPTRAGWEGSFRGGALLTLGSSWRLRAAAYSGLRLPTLNELYRPFVVFPVETRANAALSNERLFGFEGGGEFRHAGQAVSLTVFHNRVTDAIANVTLAPNLQQRQNIDAIRATGVEAQANLRWDRLRFEGSLAYTDAVARGSGLAASLDGKRPAQTPRWAMSGTLGYALDNRASIAVTARHVGAQFEDDLETDILPAATTLSAYAEWPLSRRINLVLRGENLTGETIVTRSRGGSIDLGAPRTVWLGLALSQ